MPRKYATLLIAFSICALQQLTAQSNVPAYYTQLPRKNIGYTAITSPQPQQEAYENKQKTLKVTLQATRQERHDKEAVLRENGITGQLLLQYNGYDIYGNNTSENGSQHFIVFVTADITVHFRFTPKNASTINTDAYKSDRNSFLGYYTQLLRQHTTASLQMQVP